MWNKTNQHVFFYFLQFFFIFSYLYTRTQALLDDILLLLHKLLPLNNALPHSKYQFLKYFYDFAPEIKEKNHYYCHSCLFYHGETKPTIRCSNCQKSNEYMYFYKFDIIEKIKCFFLNKSGRPCRSVQGFK